MNKFTGNRSKSGLNKLITTKTYLNGELKAKRVVVKAPEVETKTGVHPLNPRNQEALTLEAVADIYDSIVDDGVDTEGVAVEQNGQFLVLDASRRRFCCIKGEKDFPLWVIDGEPTITQLLKLINNSQDVKKWSYYEHGNYLMTVAENAEIDVKSLKNEELAEKLGIGRETLRKRLEAIGIDDELRTLFVDYEGIPNAFYGVLAKLQKKLTKAKLNISDQVGVFRTKLESKALNGTVLERQKATLEALKEFVDEAIGGGSSDSKWKETPLGEFDVKGVSAKRKTSSDGRKTVYEFNRLPADVQQKINAYIDSVLPPKNS
jgi:ParB family chromosome partitioning protein